MIIKEWIFNIVSISLIGVLLDIVIPNGNIKKYTRFIIGLITVVVILKPILNLFDQLPELEKYIALNVFNLDTKSIEYQQKIMTETQQNQLISLFRDNIEKHISHQVQKLTGYTNIHVQVELDDNIDENSIQDMGVIDKIYIQIDKENRVGAVEPIDIYVDTSRQKIGESEKITYFDEEKQSDIKKYISDVYNVNPANIYIYWKDDSS